MSNWTVTTVNQKDRDNTQISEIIAKDANSAVKRAITKRLSTAMGCRILQRQVNWGFFKKLLVSGSIMISPEDYERVNTKEAIIGTKDSPFRELSIHLTRIETSEETP